MKRTLPGVPILSIFTVAILGLTACQPTSPTANQSAAANTNAQKEEPLNIAAIEKELLQLDREWATAALTRNVEAVRRIEADDSTVTYIDGSTGTKADYIRDVESGGLTAESWDLADLKVRVLGPNSAVITGRGIIKNGKYKGPDGRTQNIDPEYRFTDVFARRDGQWKLVASQATTIKNPGAAAAQTSPSPAVSPSPSPSVAK